MASEDSGDDERQRMKVAALLTAEDQRTEEMRGRVAINALVDALESSEDIRDQHVGSSKEDRDRDGTRSGKRKRQALFSCDTCRGVFTTRRDLETHVRTVHQKLRPYKCPHCDASFGTKSNLNTHTKSVHEGQRPFPCELCSMAFKTRGNLDTHVLTVHEQKRPFVCEICQATFGTKSVKNRHVRILHKREHSESRDGGDVPEMNK